MKISDYLVKLTVVHDGTTELYSLNELTSIKLYNIFNVTFSHKNIEPNYTITNLSSALSDTQTLYCQGVYKTYPRETNLEKAVRHLLDNVNITSPDFAAIKRLLS